MGRVKAVTITADHACEHNSNNAFQCTAAQLSVCKEGLACSEPCALSSLLRSNNTTPSIMQAMTLPTSHTRL